MPDFLLFQLRGSIASWGDEQAVGTVRNTAAAPTRSAILGLIGACLGVDREDDDGNRALARTLRHALRVDRRGDPLRDYHTVQAPTTRANVTYATRAEELASGYLVTMPTTRHYLMDVAYTVALWATDKDITLSGVQAAMLRPVYTVYMGRKACPLSAPMAPRLIDADGLLSAFGQYDTVRPEQVPYADLDESHEYRWDEDPPGTPPELNEATIYHRTVTDDPVSRRVWTFRRRTENVMITRRPQ